MSAFLLEIGLEEIPAGMIAAAQAELENRFRALLARERLTTDALTVKSFSTPRRLAVLAEGLLPQQADMEEQVVGPSVAVAYKNGAPTPAALAFAKKSGVDVAALETIRNTKGEYVAATVRRPGQSVAAVLTGALPAEISGLHWPKNMYWRAGKPERFVRPVRWLVALVDEEVLPLEFAGVTAGRLSSGHRVLHGGEPIVLERPQDYAERLAAAFVAVDPEARRQRIRKALDAETRKIAGARWREDEALVDAVTHLTEWPSVLLGAFDAGYLDLPKEVLITVMRDHQKYFALEDGDRKLLPHFLAVLNIEVDAAGADLIRHGNERVLRARFNDARFFWDVDQKIPLTDRVALLKNVTFQKELGSYGDKTERNRAVARGIIDRCDPPLFDADSIKLKTFCAGVDEAARLAKADLTTEMVKEFTELQGVVGGLYTRAQHLPDGVARAIYDHYKPVSQTDTIPALLAGCVVALADKISTIADMFSIGLQPTGSKDPFALRRAGNGILRILIENAEMGAKLHLQGVCRAALDPERTGKDPGLLESLYNFLLDRFEFYLQENLGLVPQVARAVRRSSAAGMVAGDGSHRVGFGFVAGFAQALDRQAGSGNAIAVAELLKRTANILRQARERKLSYASMESAEGLREPAEIELARKVTEADAQIRRNYRQGNYDAVLAAIAGLQAPLNGFFDAVMVMAEDAHLRDNRLALLARTEATVLWAADFSELASI